jgi:FOG: LysM repeat
MANELITNKIFLDEKIGTQSTQVLIEGDIIVPDIKPDMASILQTEANIIIDKTEIMQNKINFIGHLDLHVIYIAKSTDNPIYSINNSTGIDDFLNIDNVTEDMYSTINADIEKIDYKMLNDRKINFRAVICISAEVQKECEYEIVTGIKDVLPSQLLKKNLNINRLVETRNDRFIVKDELHLTSGKPNIREILQSDIDIINRDVKAGNGKITVSGELLLKILYKSDSDENIIEISEHEIPFNGVFDVAKAKEYMFADVKLYTQDKYIQVKPNSDGEDRVIDTEIFIGANIKINSEEEIEILDDAYCINESLDMTYENIKYPNIICKNKTQSPIKEIVQLEDNCPDILQVLKINAMPHIDDTHIIDDKVIVEGIIDADILYIAQSDKTPVYSYKTILPYRQVVEVKGALSEMKTNTDITIEHIGFNMLSNNEIELRFLLSFNTYVEQEQEIKIIKDIKFNEISQEVLDNMPSMVVYVVQENDSLWKIAKHYNISIEELKQINDLEDDVKPGEKLLILKDVKV